ncbi:MAG: hypothetical protein U1E76_25195, partial [Planctomycetota bacterium]
MRFLSEQGRIALAACAGAALLMSCGGGGSGGGHAFRGGLDDPVVPLKGTGGTYSMTPEEANAANGDPTLAPPPFPAAVVKGQNQFIRLEFPFAVDRNSILGSDASLA